MRAKYFLTIALLGSQLLWGQVQERTLPIAGNRPTSYAAEGTDTLGLPFADDFSSGATPNTQRWQDRKVWVNDALPIGANSVGVASLDGTNEYGTPYKIGAYGSDTMVDVLTSSYLDLTGTSNVWLSFQYQEGGRGELPSTDDSLVVQFYSPQTSTWTHAWSTTGTGSAAAFKTAMVPVIGAQFYKRGFAFRIASFGAAAGAYDIWNIDYVQLDADRNASDSIITEPAFSKPHPLIIGNGLYTSWPWWLSMSNNLANRPSTLTFAYRRLGVVPPGGWSLNLGRYQWIENGTLIAQQTAVPVITSTNHNVDLNFDVQVPAGALVLPSGPTEVETKVWFDGSAAGFRSNDTVRGYLELDNYLALDDATAERAYAVQNISGGRLAQKFRVDGLGAADSLMGLNISFVQAGSPYKSTFRLAVWAPADTGDAPGDRIYLSDSLYEPHYGYNRGDFMPYALDSAIDISAYSHVWVGYVCTSGDPLFVGLDVERDLPASLPRYYGDGFNWYPSLESGVLLMRPYFRYQPDDMSIAPVFEGLQNINFYPNPAEHWLHITGDEGDEIRWFDAVGRAVRTEQLPASGNLDVAAMPRGLYYMWHLSSTGTRSAKLMLK